MNPPLGGSSSREVQCDMSPNSRTAEPPQRSDEHRNMSLISGRNRPAPPGRRICKRPDSFDNGGAELPRRRGLASSVTCFRRETIQARRIAVSRALVAAFFGKESSFGR